MATLDHCTCLELALEGERLCKSGDYRSGVVFFEAAIQAGSDDLKTLSAIYSQLGNAYFYLGDYMKAMSFHKHDLTLARTMGDKLGEAKASGNLGNTLKIMGRYDEAIICCTRHLDITKQLDDKTGQARAYYNLGNAYHAKGKYIGKLGQQDPGEFPEDVKACLTKALELYMANLDLTKELNDRSAEGRACGNLGNVHYLLGNFDEAIAYHDQRLEIAKEFGDKNAQRRAHTNLGNAHVFSGNFETAAQHYKKSLLLSQDLSDHALEAQACYSLGNTYTLLRDYPKAVEYHLRHLQIAQNLHDKVGEGRAFWSLGNAYSAMGDHTQALRYAKQHFTISTDLGDQMGQATAQMNVNDLRKVLGLTGDEDIETNPSEESKYSTNRRKSMEEMNLIRMTPEAASSNRGRGKNPQPGAGPSGARQNRSLSVGQVLFRKGRSQDSSSKLSKHISKTSELEEEEEEGQDQFFDLLSKCQAERMDDQRCSLPQERPTSSKTARKEASDSHPFSSSSLHSKAGSFKQSHSNDPGKAVDKENKEKKPKVLPPRALSVPAYTPKSQATGEGESSGGSEDLLDMIWGMQSKRMDEQRACLPQSSSPEEKFFDMLIRSQSSRLEDQRSVLPEDCAAGTSRGPTVPDEDFFSLIARLQEGRMDDQRADIKDKNRNKIN